MSLASIARDRGRVAPAIRQGSPLGQAMDEIDEILVTKGIVVARKRPWPFNRGMIFRQGADCSGAIGADMSKLADDVTPVNAFSQHDALELVVLLQPVIEIGAR